MFNSPILDTAIGLVFIFLLYSLLATSVKEAIATLFGLRARMLKTGIVEGMLSDTSKDNRWTSILKGIWSYFVEFYHLLIWEPKKPREEEKLGDRFYSHPLIKNYGSSRIYPTPSYIPTNNFSTVLIDVLKQEYSNRIPGIAAIKHNLPGNTYTLDEIEQNLRSVSDSIKIKELLEYYTAHFRNGSGVIINRPIIDCETVEILQMHLQNAVYDINEFTKKVEDWFDDSMDRVSGWYKRQVQVILFIIGMVVAIIFNVDTVGITTKLSTDKDARDKMVTLAVQGAEQFKDDPRVKRSLDKNGVVVYDSNDSEKNNSIYKQYKSQMDSARSLLNGNINDANTLLALGWSGYGKNDSGFIAKLKHKIWIRFFKIVHLESIFDSVARYDLTNPTAPFYKTNEARIKGAGSSLFIDSVKNARFYDKEMHDYPVRLKIAYVLHAISAKKLLGFLLTAFAICLGAPFWFDLLSKLVSLRAAGKKETNDNEKKPEKSVSPQQPVTVNVNTQNTGGEAVG
jgi:hypothetical protein